VFHVVLYEPEIPPNTGNIMRLCANTGCQLHLVGKLGFDLDDSRLRRAGLDYRDLAVVTQHADWEGFCAALSVERLALFSTRASQLYTQRRYRSGDVLVFGPETRGLPATMLERYGMSTCWRLPMRDSSRSLNLSNSVAVVVYEAWRQCGFDGGA
jgi:tRNA (cytidine/uridine-2'-O-)-methyltransferase